MGVLKDPCSRLVRRHIQLLVLKCTEFDIDSAGFLQSHIILVSDHETVGVCLIRVML